MSLSQIAAQFGASESSKIAVTSFLKENGVTGPSFESSSFSFSSSSSSSSSSLLLILGGYTDRRGV